MDYELGDFAKAEKNLSLLKMEKIDSVPQLRTFLNGILIRGECLQKHMKKYNDAIKCYESGIELGLKFLEETNMNDLESKIFIESSTLNLCLLLSERG